MERKPPSSLGDFLAVLKRRKYWTIIPFVIVAGLGIGLSPLVPRSYRSASTILVVPQKVPTAYVKPSTSDVMNRLNRIGLEIMSGNGFLNIIDSLNLYPNARGKRTPAQLIATMRKDISVDIAPDSSDGQGGAGAFIVSYIGPTPAKAQQATREIADLFIQENKKEQTRLALGTDAFLTQQVNQAAQRLADEQAKIQSFKSAHLDSLPEQTQVNLGTIAGYRAELQANAAAINQDNQQRVYHQSVLNVSPTGSNSVASATPEAPSALQIALAKKQAELSADLLKYTPQFPDVIRLKHEIAALQLQILHQPKSNAATAAPQIVAATGPTMNDQLRGQLLALNTDLQSRKAQQRQLEQQIQTLQGSVLASPAVQTQYTALTSEYQELQKNYNNLVDKQQDAGMAVQLEQNNDSEQFVVLDPANLPTVPYRPNPILLYMGSVFLGLFAGLLCALAVELRDDTIHNAEEAAAYLKLPVMVGLPKCPPFPSKAWQTDGSGR